MKKESGNMRGNRITYSDATAKKLKILKARKGMFIEDMLLKAIEQYIDREFTEEDKRAFNFVSTYDETEALAAGVVTQAELDSCFKTPRLLAALGVFGLEEKAEALAKMIADKKNKEEAE